MGVRKEKFIREYVASGGDKDWRMDEPFTAVTFAYWFNQKHGNHATAPSGLRVYFLRMEKDGLIKVNRDEETNKILTYERVIKDDDSTGNQGAIQAECSKEASRAD